MIMPWLLSLFVRRTWFPLMLIAVLAILLYGMHWFWLRPQMWNGTADYYYKHERKLSRDSVRWHKDSTSFVGIVAIKDAAINLLKVETDSALSYGKRWKRWYATSVAVSDSVTDQLTDKERELAYYKALQANGTLTKNPAVALTPQNPIVISAGLKTANREAIGAKVRDSLTNSIGLYTARNERLRQGLGLGSTKLAGVAAKARSLAKGGVWPFNVKRKAQLRSVADSADSGKKQVEKVDEFEQMINY